MNNPVSKRFLILATIVSYSIILVPGQFIAVPIFLVMFGKLTDLFSNFSVDNFIGGVFPVVGIVVLLINLKKGWKLLYFVAMMFMYPWVIYLCSYCIIHKMFNGILLILQIAFMIISISGMLYFAATKSNKKV